MNHFSLKFLVVLFLSIMSFKEVFSQIFIVAQVNQEIITNVDLEFEKNT